MTAAAPSTPTAAPTAVLIVGMHRSGTSAVTRVLNLHGVALGDRLLPPADDNPQGFWEHADVVAIHERLLGAMGRSWKDPRPFPDDWLDLPAAARARDEIGDVLDRDFPGVPLFGIKDPRLSEFLGLWLPVLAMRGIRATVLHVVRHPDEIADSLQRRDGWPRSLGKLLWARSTVAAVEDSATVERCVIRYDDVMDDPGPVVERVARVLDLPLVFSPEIDHEVRTFLDPGARHHERDPRREVVPRYVAQLHSALLGVAAGGPWEPVHKIARKYSSFYEASGAIHSEYAETIALSDAFARRSVDLERQLVEMRARHAEERGQGAPAGVGTQMLLLESMRNDDRVVAYYRAEGQGYSEALSHNVAWARNGTTLSMQCEIPGAVEASFLRIDPSEMGGWFDIGNLEIDGAPVDVAELMLYCNGSLLQAPQPGGVGFVGDDNDPFVEIRLPAAPEGENRHVRFDVGKRGLLSSFNILTRSLRQVEEALPRHADAVSTVLAGRIDVLARDLDAASSVVRADTERASRDLLTGLESTGNAVEGVGTAVRVVGETVDHARAYAAQAFEAARTSLQSLSEGQARANDALEAGRATMEALTEGQARANDALDAGRATMEALTDGQHRAEQAAEKAQRALDTLGEGQAHAAEMAAAEQRAIEGVIEEQARAKEASEKSQRTLLDRLAEGHAHAAGAAVAAQRAIDEVLEEQARAAGLAGSGLQSLNALREGQAQLAEGVSTLTDAVGTSLRLAEAASDAADAAAVTAAAERERMVLFMEELRLRESAGRQQAMAQQAVLQGLLEGMDLRARQASEALHETRRSLAAIDARLEDEAGRTWRSRTRRLLGLEGPGSQESKA